MRKKIANTIWRHCWHGVCIFDLFLEQMRLTTRYGGQTWMSSDISMTTDWSNVQMCPCCPQCHPAGSQQHTYCLWAVPGQQRGQPQRNRLPGLAAAGELAPALFTQKYNFNFSRIHKLVLIFFQCKQRHVASNSWFHLHILEFCGHWSHSVNSTSYNTPMKASWKVFGKRWLLRRQDTDGWAHGFLSLS